MFNGLNAVDEVVVQVAHDGAVLCPGRGLVLVEDSYMRPIDMESELYLNNADD